MGQTPRRWADLSGPRRPATFAGPRKIDVPTPRYDTVGEAAQPFHRKRHLVAGPERRRSALPEPAPELRQRTPAAGARAEDVPGAYPGVPGRIGDHLLEGPRAVGERVAADELAVEGDRH